MKNWKLPLLVAAAVLSLQACDVSVHETPKDQTAATSEAVPAPAPEPAPAATTETTAAADPSAAGASAPVAGASAPLAEPPVAGASAPADGMAAAPQEPGTNAMGGPAPSAPMSSDGVAAPTELARFLDANPLAGKDAKTKP